MIDYVKYDPLKGLERTAKQIFDNAIQPKYSINDFIQWNSHNRVSTYYTERSDMVEAIIRNSLRDASFIQTPYSKGLAITINYRNYTHTLNDRLLANAYEVPLRQIIHIFRETFMHHSRLICLGCFELDKNKLVHCHFVLDGNPLRGLDDRTIYGYYKAIQFLTCEVLPDTDPNIDVCVKRTRDLGFLRYSLKTLEGIKTDSGFKIDTSPIFYNPILKPKTH